MKHFGDRRHASNNSHTLPNEFRTQAADVMRDLWQPDSDEPRELRMPHETGERRPRPQPIMDRRWR